MLDAGLDQAAGLRALMAPGPLPLLAFPLATGDAPGWIARLARALRGAGHRPVVLDAAHGRLAGAFGVRPRLDLAHMLRGERSFDEVACGTPEGVYVVRADEGVDAFLASGEPASRLLGGFARLSHGFDHLLLAMPAAEIASLADPLSNIPVVGLGGRREDVIETYRVVKQLAEGFGYRTFACVALDAHRAQDGLTAQQRLAAAAARFLGVDVRPAGWLPARGAAPAEPVAATFALLTATALAQRAHD